MVLGIVLCNLVTNVISASVSCCCCWGGSTDFTLSAGAAAGCCVCCHDKCGGFPTIPGGWEPRKTCWCHRHSRCCRRCSRGCSDRLLLKRLHVLLEHWSHHVPHSWCHVNDVLHLLSQRTSCMKLPESPIVNRYPTMKCPWKQTGGCAQYTSLFGCWSGS